MARISAYRTLSSPAYISQTAQDPILEAFQLYKELHDWSNYEPEFRKDYVDLAQRCSDYSVALLGHCRRREEVSNAFQPCISILYINKVLVRSRLECCVQAWRPYLSKDIELLGIQKRMTRMLPELRGLSYPERLKALGVTALETRRLGGDLIEMFNIVKGFVNIGPVKRVKPIGPGP